MTTLQITIICLFTSTTIIAMTLIVCGCWMRVRERGRMGHTHTFNAREN